MLFYKEQNEEILYAKAMRNYCRRIAENYVLMKRFCPDEKKKLKELKKEMQRYSRKMCGLPGNSSKQKMSAVMYAFIPMLWDRVYAKL